MVCMLLFFLFKDSFPSKYLILFFNELIKKNTDKTRALSFLKENKNTVNQRAHYILLNASLKG